MPGKSYEGTAYQKEALAVSTAAVPFTASKLVDTDNTKCKAVEFTTDQPLRVWFDGSTPTSTAGLKIPSGGPYVISGAANVANALLILDSTKTGDATVHCVYMKD
jgi:hypothetical protein